MEFLAGWIGSRIGTGAARAVLRSMASAAHGHDLEVLDMVELSDDVVIAAGGGAAHFCDDDGVVAVVGAPFWRDDSADQRAEASAPTIYEAYRASGTGLLEMLAGSYLLIIADRHARRVLMATDRFGIKPGYFASCREGVVFASSLKSALAHPGVDTEIDDQSLLDYVFYHCVPSPHTIYRAVRKLQPAELVEWDDGRLSARHYWFPAFAGASDERGRRTPSRDDLLTALRRSVARAARSEHTGAFLSGGLDSSSVAGMLKEITGAAATFTIGFDAEGYDESRYAHIAARHFATDHHEYFVTPDDVVDVLPKIAAFYDEPFGNSSVVPAFYCAELARRNGVDLMLAGDGGDELFAGNERYVQQGVFERYFRVPRIVRAALEGAYESLPLLKQLPIFRKGHRYIEQALMGLPDRIQSYNFLNRFDSDDVFNREWLRGVDTERPWNSWRERYRELELASPLQRMLYLDWKFTLADNDLVKVSGMCSLAGIKVDYPMLGDELVSVATGLTEDELLASGRLRAFYKAAVNGFLPPAIISKSKHGFGLPFGVWMREHPALQELVSDCLSAIKARHIFDRGFIDQAMLRHRREAPGYYGELLWILMALELWLQAHHV